ncbi:MAG: DUF370 domain-containing protein [Clostridia bacterium]|jgi:hypothetical protein|nr:DUF370 domain-containing protein [Clostridia bacterium]
MFLHIGENESVLLESVIGIFDLETTTTMQTTKDFITNAEKNGEILINSEVMPKSFILTEEGGIDSLYVSSVNVATLRKRIEQLTKDKFDPSELKSCEIIFSREEK